MIKKIFKYIEPLWLGTDGKISLRSFAAMALIIDFISNLSHAIYKWDAGRSLEGLSLVLGIEAGLVVSLLGLTAWTNLSNRRISRGFRDYDDYTEYRSSNYDYDRELDPEKPSEDPDVPKVEVPKTN